MAKGKVLALKREIPKTWEEALQEFLFWKQAQGLAERTLTDYRKQVSQLYHRHPEAYDPQKLKPVVLVYMSQEVKPATFNLRLVYLKAFFDWCIPEGICFENPLNGFRRRKTEDRVVNIEETVLSKLISLQHTCILHLRRYKDDCYKMG